jgi:hypothetical protein
MSDSGLQSLRDSVRQERVDAVQSFGFTERQARFLVHVLVHSGVFVEAARFPTSPTAEDARVPGQARRPRIRQGDHTPGALHRGRPYHVQYKPLYRAAQRESWPLCDGRVNTPTIRRVTRDRGKGGRSPGRFLERCSLLEFRGAAQSLGTTLQRDSCADLSRPRRSS